METRKFYQVGYTKAVGGTQIITVKARNKTEAIANAKNMRHTGKNFYVLREVKSAKSSAKGGTGYKHVRKLKKGY